jgi:hypothetical protein
MLMLDQQVVLVKAASLLKAPAPTAIEHLGFTTEELSVAHGREEHKLPKIPVEKLPIGADKLLAKVKEQHPVAEI